MPARTDPALTKPGSFEIAGSTLEVAVLDGRSPRTRQHVVPWLKTAAELASQPLGRFPRASAHVVVIPSAPGDEPVRFAMLGRGGGASVVSLLASNAERQALLDDWVAVHEFCHMLHPFLQRQDAWLSEGLATYYQEVLRARTGHQSEQDAWRRIHDGAALGKTAHGSLEQASAAMFQNANFRMVYWGGAAFALLTAVASLSACARRLARSVRSAPCDFSSVSRRPVTAASAAGAGAFAGFDSSSVTRLPSSSNANTPT